MFTNQLRFTGTSGIDVESMVSQLMKAESMKYDKLYQQRELLKYKQTAYQGVTKSLLDFQDKFLAFGKSTTLNMRSSFNFKGLQTVVQSGGKETSAAVIKASEKVTAGSYTLKVNQTAKADTYKAAAPGGNTLRAAADLDVANIQEGDSFKIVLDGGAVKDIKFDATFMTDMKNLGGANGGVNNANFAATLNDRLKTTFGMEADGVTQKVKAGLDGNRLTISAGVGHSASIGTGTRVGASNTIVNQTDIAALASSGKTSFDVNVGGVNYEVRGVDLSGATDAADVAKKLNEALKTATAGTDAKAVPSVTFAADKDGNLTVTNANADARVTIGGGVAGGELFASPTNLNSASAMTAMGVLATQQKTTGLDLYAKVTQSLGYADSEGIGFNINGKDFEFDAATTSINDILNAVNKSGVGVKMSFDSVRQEFTMESTSTGSVNNIKFSDGKTPGPGVTYTSPFLSKLGFGTSNAAVSTALNPTARTQAGQDAIIEMNGVTTSRETNNFSIDGFDITLTKDVTAGQEFNIQVSKNTDGVLSMIKSFVADYNTLIESLNKQVGTARTSYNNYSYYEPLTEDQRKSMSESAIKSWDEQAKTGMLYRDQSINNVLSDLRGMLYQSVTMDDGSKLSLFELGITTVNANSIGSGKAGTLQIDETKLTKAIENMGDKVEQFFTKVADSGLTYKKNKGARLASEGFAERVNDIIEGAAGIRGTLYEKAGLDGLKITTEMSKKIKTQDDKLADMLKYLQKQENYYYSTFGKMEAAMNQANSQLAALQGMLGYNN